jgi:Bacterial Ig-like domain (group 3)
LTYGSAGTHLVTAAYPGDAAFAASASAPLTQAVQITTATALSSSANPSLAGQQVTFTATVSPAPDGGTIAFEDGGTAIAGCGAVPVSSGTGTATCQTSALPTATGQITAVYAGDASYQGSASAALAQVVQADTPQALAALTLQYVQGSAKFQALPPAQQKLVTAVADQAIAQLAKISPHLTPQQLAALVAAYKQGVAGLQAQGWLTAGQAGTLDSLASTVQA